VNGRTVYDSERHGRNVVTVKEAFKFSSNVGMAKLVTEHYSKQPQRFVNMLRDLRLHETTKVDLIGETNPVIKTPKSKTWSATTLPWMSFGYEVLVSPLQTLVLYNALANDGKMMRPYLLHAVNQGGIEIERTTPEIVNSSICSATTLQLLRECLEAVCNEEGGTGYQLFANAPYRVAGKTGTALVANGKRGYGDHIYQSSFAGYFPADNPQYSCIVVIRNKPFAKKYYGGVIAGPVFKEVADKLFALNVEKTGNYSYAIAGDSSYSQFAGASRDVRIVYDELQVPYTDSAFESDWTMVTVANTQQQLNGKQLIKGTMPDVTGMGLKDAVYLLERKKLEVLVKGKGKVRNQSIKEGEVIHKNQRVLLELF
jgi:cell division protein FtsI (penicillin-binding protein 3)